MILIPGKHVLVVYCEKCDVRYCHLNSGINSLVFEPKSEGLLEMLNSDLNNDIPFSCIFMSYLV